MVFQYFKGRRWPSNKGGCSDFDFLFEDADGMDGTSFIKYGFYRIPPCPAWGNHALENYVSIKSGGGWYNSYPLSPLIFERLKKRALCFLFKESYTEIHPCGIHGFHLCHSQAAVGYTGRCRIPNLNIQSSTLGKSSRPFFHFLFLFLKDNFFFLNVKNSHFCSHLDPVSPPHSTDASQGRDQYLSLPTFSSKLQTLKYGSGKLVENFILMRFVNKSPS